MSAQPAFADAPLKTFTVDEANRALPYVQRVAEDIVEAYGDVKQLRRTLDAQIVNGEDTTLMDRHYEQAMDRLGGLMDELKAVGCELRDFEQGLIDFPADQDGREVMLCWQLGEPRVSHWHEVDEGFADRRDIASL